MISAGSGSISSPSLILIANQRGLQFFGETGVLQDPLDLNPMAGCDHFDKRVRQTRPLFVLVVGIGTNGAFQRIHGFRPIAATCQDIGERM